MLVSRNPNESLQATPEMIEAAAATGMHLVTITCDSPGEFLQALILTSFLPPVGSVIFLENLAEVVVTGHRFAVRSAKNIKFLQAFTSGHLSKVAPGV